MSGSRIKVAGRFKPCLHIGCFDLDTFVEINQRARKVCGLHICTCSNSSRFSDVRIFFWMLFLQQSFLLTLLLHSSSIAELGV
jgi:hypothetical protein